MHPRTLAIKARWDTPPRLTVELTDGEFREVAPIEPRGRKPQDTTAKHDAAFLEAVDLLQAEGRPATMGAIRAVSSLNSTNANRAAERLVLAGAIVASAGEISLGNKASRAAKVFVRSTCGQRHMDRGLSTCSEHLDNAPL